MNFSCRKFVANWIASRTRAENAEKRDWPRSIFYIHICLQIFRQCQYRELETEPRALTFGWQ